MARSLRTSTASLDELISRALPVFEARPEIVSAYLFGSQARGDAGPTSDLDLAIFRQPSFVPSESGWQTYWGDLHAELVRALCLGDDDVDLVVLNDVKNPSVAHRATWRGRLIYCRDHVTRVRLETAVLWRYLDAAPLRRLQSISLRERALRS